MTTIGHGRYILLWYLVKNYEIIPFAYTDLFIRTVIYFPLICANTACDPPKVDGSFLLVFTNLSAVFLFMVSGSYIMFCKYHDIAGIKTPIELN